MSRSAPSARARSAALLGAAAATVLLVVLWGRDLEGSTRALHLGAAPFYGAWDLRLGWRTIPAVALGAALVAGWPALADRLRWSWALVASAAASMAWSVALAASDGWDRLWSPLVTKWEYLPLARSIDRPGDLVSGFLDRIDQLPTHVRGHPPGAVLLFWVVDRFASSDMGAALVVVAAGASTAPAALVALDRLCGRAVARRALPYAGLAPAVVWMATSADALFAALVAWAVALGAVAATAEGRAARIAAAAGSGLVAGLALAATYGAVLFLAPLWAVAAVTVVRQRRDPARPALLLAVAAAGVAVVLGAFAAAGFWWFDGVSATREQYLAGVAPERPYRYFVVANLAVLAVACGPAAIAALGRWRAKGSTLVAGALVGVLAADLSGFTKGEVERIWLPFVPFVVLATAWLPDRPAARRTWLGAQLGVGLVVQVVLRSHW